MNETIVVRINRRQIETTIDDSGVQRLPNHPIIRYLMHRASFDMNELAILTDAGVISEDDRRFVYQNIGYSVDGYADVFPDDEIDNPLWNDET